ncbi:MAG: glucosamine-6-phosphate deaminase [Oscillospiraceae bacterium]|nr:glucosamine-6-phosphate deaminase [Oscillospiraceae bacterium]
MKLIAVANYEEMSARAAEILLEQVCAKPDSVLGLATGSTPVGTYQNMVTAYERGEASFAQCRSVNLDEYVGLGSEDEASYHYFMWHNLFHHIDIRPENAYLPDGKNLDARDACTRYDQLVSDLGPIDLQVLGIGSNGHIAFNEPGDHFVADTHIVDLTDATIDDNQRFFQRREDVPTQAYTLGMRPILNARLALLLVTGAGKAEALHRSLTGPITSTVPASILQLHNNLIVIADEAALSKF